APAGKEEERGGEGAVNTGVSGSAKTPKARASGAASGAAAATGSRRVPLAGAADVKPAVAVGARSRSKTASAPATAGASAGGKTTSADQQRDSNPGNAVSRGSITISGGARLNGKPDPSSSSNNSS
ncbi:unnamed protein product, partial [Ectocarpus sp. 12 AP-2014]